MTKTGATLVLSKARVLDTDRMQWCDPGDLMICDGRVVGVDEQFPKVAERIDVGGRRVIPGLIDAHVHVMASDSDYRLLAETSPYLVAARASRILHDMLLRGFTTVRDAGGADAGLRQAVEEGSMLGPRLLVCDLGLAQTGGQGDFRSHPASIQGCPTCHGRRGITRLVDGTTALRQAVRDMLHAGADHIKVMASGGIASGIPIDRLQYSNAELAVIVDEARRAGTYVMAHAYKDEAVRRCIELGIISIEHASHLDDTTCRMLVNASAFIVPTLSVYEAHADTGSFTSRLFAEMLEASLDSLHRAHAHGVSIGHGSDLTGAQHDRQSREFLLKAQAMPPVEVLRCATTTNAALLGRSGLLGTLAPGAQADLIVLDGDPLEDAAVLADPLRYFRLIAKNGVIHKNTLANL